MKIIDYRSNIEKYKNLHEYFIVEQGINLELYSIKQCKVLRKGKIEIEFEKATLENVIKEILKEKNRKKKIVCKKYNLSEEEFNKYEEEFNRLSNEYVYCRNKKEYKEFIAKNFENKATSIQDKKKFRFFYDLTLENYIKAIKDSNFNIKEIREKEKEEK